MLHTNDNFGIESGLPLPTKKRPEPRRRRSYVRAACNSCRTRKVACDGERPVCNNCSKKALHCAYVTLDADETQTSALKRKVQELQEDLNDQTELINQLATGPEDAVLALVRQLRASRKSTTIIKEIHNDIMYKRHRASVYSPPRLEYPLPQMNCVLENTVLFSTAYPALPKMNTASISINDLFASRRSYSVSATPLIRSPSAQSLDLENKYPSPPPDDFWQAGAVQAPAYTDERLKRLRISYWTCVPITDEYAASVISLYLQVDHPYQGFVDADLFIRDLVDLKSNFCSPFLVAALFSYACQMYSAIDPRSSAISQAFCVQAETLWKAERASDSLINAVALQMFSLACLCQGRDKLSIQLLDEGRLMAERINLFNVPPSHLVESQFRAMSPEWQRATTHSAWGIYTWLTYHACFFEDQGVLFPPMYPIPGRYSTEPAKLGEIQYAMNSSSLHTNGIFSVICELCVIGQEVAVVYNQKTSEPIASRVPLAFAESKYRKLLAWVENLPFDLVRTEDCGENVIIMHIVFHVFVLAVFRPFLGDTQMRQLYNLSSTEMSYRSVYAASVDQIKYLILSLRLKFPHSLNPIIVSSGHVQICSAMLLNRSDPDWKFYFMLCVAYFRELYTRFQVAGWSIQGILALAMVNDAITSAEARKIMDGLKSKGRHHVKVEDVSVSIVLNVDQEYRPDRGAIVDVLARKFEELTMEQDSMRGGHLPVQGQSGGFIVQSDGPA